MSAPAVRYAIVGCGNVAARHAQAIADTKHARLVAAVDGIPERAARLAAECGAEVCPSIDALACRSDVDAVVVRLPSALHAQVGLFLAESGKHLLVEKPIAVDASAADELVQCCAARGVALSVVSQHRFHDDMASRSDEEGVNGSRLCRRRCGRRSGSPGR